VMAVKKKKKRPRTSPGGIEFILPLSTLTLLAKLAEMDAQMDVELRKAEKALAEAEKALETDPEKWTEAQLRTEIARLERLDDDDDDDLHESWAMECGQD